MSQRIQLLSYIDKTLTKLGSTAEIDATELKSKVMPAVVKSIRAYASGAPVEMMNQLKQFLDESGVLPNYDADLNAFKDVLTKISDFIKSTLEADTSVENTEAVAAAPSMPPAACQAASAGDSEITLQEVERLCLVGTAGETTERQHKALAASGAKARRAQHARETLDILAAGRYTAQGSGETVEISAILCRAVESSKFFGEGKWHKPTALVGEQRLRCEVRCCTVLAAAQDLAISPECHAAPGVLNFASARNPGGGFTTGAEAQEESLARSSGIYPCLSKHFKTFFEPHRRAASGLYTHGLIHSPGVPVVRDEFGTLLDEPYLIDFVTAAAPNCGVLKGKCGDREAAVQCAAAFRERIRRVLHVFASNGCIDLVLGAWGCGVFGNDPATVARLFQEALDEIPHFRRVVFAVLDPEMAEVFAEELQSPVQGLANATKQHGKGKGAGKAKSKDQGKKGKGDSKGESRKARRWQKGQFPEHGD
mmetsp:Transcript_38985/g.72197  ORF Transcript_38985/g.72197 Transcript_38985/m.72197 type:complete len:481 (-) Transcript_38985:91-1533(-)